MSRLVFQVDYCGDREDGGLNGGYIEGIKIIQERIGFSFGLVLLSTLIER